MDLQAIQAAFARLESIEKLLGVFKSIADLVKDGGGMGLVELEIKVKDPGRLKEQPKRSDNPFVNMMMDHGHDIIEFYSTGSLFQSPKEQPKSDSYKHHIEIKPNDSETLRVFAVFVDRLLEERKQHIEFLKSSGVKITLPTT
ncbi:MAG: hypothetical protein ACRCYO_13430 [Bacteroidia bacterium]